MSGLLPLIGMQVSGFWQVRRGCRVEARFKDAGEPRRTTLDSRAGRKSRNFLSLWRKLRLRRSEVGKQNHSGGRPLHKDRMTARAQRPALAGTPAKEALAGRSPARAIRWSFRQAANGPAPRAGATKRPKRALHPMEGASSEFFDGGWRCDGLRFARPPPHGTCRFRCLASLSLGERGLRAKKGGGAGR